METFCLSATKCDLREVCQRPITTKEGEALYQKIKADGYVECSSKFMWNVNRVFEEALLSVVGKPKKPRSNKSNCILL